MRASRTPRIVHAGGQRGFGGGWQVGLMVVLASVSITGAVQAESFPPELELSSLLEINGGDGSNGVAFLGIDADDDSGRAVAAAGDINGDGIADLVIGAVSADPNGAEDAGEAYVFFGTTDDFPAEFELSRLLPENGGDGRRGFVVQGVSAGDEAGWSVASAGDLNGDGIDDLAIGAHRADTHGMDSGDVYVVFGSVDRFDAAFDLARLLPVNGGDGSEGFVARGVAAGDQAGRSVAPAGDLNADGIDDLAIGALFADPNGIVDAGESYVLFGRSDGFPPVFELASLFPGEGGNGLAGFVLQGFQAASESGVSVSAAGDVNTDGVGDLLIGAWLTDSDGGTDAGESYVAFGQRDGFPPVMSLADLRFANGGDGDLGFILGGVDAFDSSAYTIARGGDINADGIDDLLVGATFAAPRGEIDAGETYVAFGSDRSYPPQIPLRGLSPKAGGDGTFGCVLEGIDAGDTVGVSVAPAGDVNADGIDDLVAGARFADPNGDIDGGEAYVVFGSLSAFPAILPLAELLAVNGGDGSVGFVLNGSFPADFTGRSVSRAGDVNADGVDDLLIGAVGADPGGRDGAGASYLVFGRPLLDCGAPAQCGVDRGDTKRHGLERSFLDGPFDDEYLVGDWDGNGCDDVAVRRDNLVLMSTDSDEIPDFQQTYGLGNAEDEYLVGDWNQDGCDDLAVRRDDLLLLDTNFDSEPDIELRIGNGNAEDQYLIGDLDGSGEDDFAVRRGNVMFRDIFPWDGIVDGDTEFGLGNAEDDYFVGHWSGDGTGKQTFAVRRGGRIFMNFDFDTDPDRSITFGRSAGEDEYLVGDWNGDGRDNVALRRGNVLLKDIDFDGVPELRQSFGLGTE